MESAGTLLILLLVAGAIFFVAIYNGLISSKNNVIRSWSDVAAYQRQKIKLLPDLEKLTRDYLEYEGSLLRDVTELRASLGRISPTRVDIKALIDIERRTDAVLSRFQAVVEDYPDLQSAGLVRDLMAELIELEENIAAAITIFNRNVADFNSGIEIFPNNVVNALSAKLTVYPAFRDSAAEREIEYQFRG